jgi:hypothetical protein
MDSIVAGCKEFEAELKARDSMWEMAEAEG